MIIILIQTIIVCEFINWAKKIIVFIMHMWYAYAQGLPQKHTMILRDLLEYVSLCFSLVLFSQ